jgi:hypothetical protein
VNALSTVFCRSWPPSPLAESPPKPSTSHSRDAARATSAKIAPLIVSKVAKLPGTNPLHTSHKGAELNLPNTPHLNPTYQTHCRLLLPTFQFPAVMCMAYKLNSPAQMGDLDDAVIGIVAVVLVRAIGPFATSFVIGKDTRRSVA